MKRFLPLLLVLAAIPCAAAQNTTVCNATTASVASPCLPLAWNNASMAATITAGTSGIETSGPGTGTIYKCTGAATTCTAASLAAFVSSGTAGPWSVLGTTPQTTPAGLFPDWALVYGQIYNYAVNNTWTGGGTGPLSGIFQVVMPASPQSAPGAPTTPTGTLQQ